MSEWATTILCTTGADAWLINQEHLGGHTQSRTLGKRLIIKLTSSN